MLRALGSLLTVVAFCAVASANRLAPVEGQVSYFMIDGEGRLDIGPPSASGEAGTITGGAAYNRFDASSWPLADCSTSQSICADFTIFGASIPINASIKLWSSRDWSFRWKSCLVGQGQACELTLYEFKHKSNGRAGTYGYSRQLGLQFVRTTAARRNEVDSFVLISEHGLRLSAKRE